MKKIKQIHVRVLLPAIVISSLMLTLTSVGGETAKLFGAEAQQQQQNQTADPQQVKSYLNQAIQAIDNGNSTQALRQLELAEDQLEVMTGAESVEDEDEDEEEEEREDDPGEVDD
ncbi:MAG TPA: hypothetical protein VFR94_17220 [Nitrososphaeraceae archaeon]|nr:hypothetical protein [Nitrososphaeraceae archaeon]